MGEETLATICSETQGGALDSAVPVPQKKRGIEMNVSNKVAILAMLPAAGILLYGLASIFIYPTSIEAKVSIVSSIATSVTVLFLISERLRESARRKLEYLNKKALTPALKVGRAEINQIEPDQSKILSQSREMLK